MVRDGRRAGARSAEAPPAACGCATSSTTAAAAPRRQRNVGWRADRGAARRLHRRRLPARARTGSSALLAAAARARRRLSSRAAPSPTPTSATCCTASRGAIEVTAPSAWYETCNIAYPRALLERLGGFDERFAGLGGEDTDLGAARREAEGGARSIVDEALVWHAVHSRTLARRRCARPARRTASPLLFARHPEQRARRSSRASFWKRSTCAPALLALARLAGARRPPARRCALALLPSSTSTTRSAQQPRPAAPAARARAPPARLGCRRR